MKTIDVLVAVLLVIGGLNWGLVGAVDFNLVRYLFGDMTVLSRLIYTLVGASAIFQAFEWREIPRRWGLAHAIS